MRRGVQALVRERRSNLWPVLVSVVSATPIGHFQTTKPLPVNAEVGREAAMGSLLSAWEPHDILLQMQHSM